MSLKLRKKDLKACRRIASYPCDYKCDKCGYAIPFKIDNTQFYSCLVKQAQSIADIGGNENVKKREKAKQNKQILVQRLQNSIKIFWNRIKRN